MAVKVRLMRIGAKKRPFYRVVAIDERKKRTGAYLELLGTYNPITQPKEINLKQDRIDEWVKKGAQLSPGFLRVIGKAPQRPPRKPKKAQSEAPAKTPAAPPAPEAAAEEAPAQAEEPNGEALEEAKESNESEESKVEETPDASTIAEEETSEEIKQ